MVLEVSQPSSQVSIVVINACPPKVNHNHQNSYFRACDSTCSGNATGLDMPLPAGRS